MKIRNYGCLGEDGISIICPRCKCEFVLEDRNDINSEEVERYDFNEKIKVNARRYFVECPMCKLNINLGDEKYVPHPNYYMIFRRKDWAERFR